MGLFDGLFGGDEHTVTSENQYLPQIEEAHRRIAEAALLGMDPFLSNPTVTIAERTPYQNRALQLATDGLEWNAHRRYGDMALNYLGGIGAGTNYANDAAGYVGNQQDRIGDNLSGGALSTVGAGEAAMPAAAHIEQIGHGDIASFANPFAEAMTDMAIERIDDDRRKREADIASRAARRGAFGGSGEAVAHFLNDQDTGDRVDDAVRQIAYDSYGQGAGIAQTNVGLVNNAQDRMINTVFQAANNDRAGYSLGDSLQSNYMNRGMNADQFDLNTMAAADGLENSFWNRNQGNLRNDLTTLTTAEGLDSGYLDRMSGTTDMLNIYGADLQGYNQSLHDQPYTQFNRLSGFMPNYQPNQVSSQPVYSNPISGGLGMLSTIAGIGSGFGLWG